MITIYLICFLVGVGFSALSLVSMFGHGFHHHGHGHGHIGHGHGDAHVGHGHGHATHHAPAHHHATNGAVARAEQLASDLSEASTPLLLRVNIAALVNFLACFGGVGLLATQWIGPYFAAAIAGAAGVAGSALINRIIGAFAGHETPLEAVSMPGTLANVTMPIRDGGGTGEIVYAIEGTRRCSGARSHDGRAVDKGTEVVILRYEKGIAYVSSLDDFPPRIEAPQ